MTEPQEASRRPLSQLSAAHVEGSLINLVTIKMIWWWSAKQNIVITNDFLWNDLMTHIGDTFLVVKALPNNPQCTPPAIEHRWLSSSAGTRGVLHSSYCSCISGTQLDGTAPVYSTRIHDIWSWNSGPSRIPCVFPQFLQAISGSTFEVQPCAVPHNYDGLIIQNQTNYHGRHLLVGSVAHKPTGCHLYSCLSLCYRYGIWQPISAKSILSSDHGVPRDVPRDVPPDPPNSSAFILPS